MFPRSQRPQTTRRYDGGAGKEIVETVEREWATVGEKAERREAVLKDEAEKETKARLEAERRLWTKWGEGNYLFWVEALPPHRSEVAD